MKENTQSPQPFDSAQGKPTSEIPEYSPPPPSGPSKLLIILGGVVILILGIAGGWYYGRSITTAENTQTNVTPSGVETAAVEDDIKEWETYNNSFYGFSFQYPNSYSTNTVTTELISLTSPVLNNTNFTLSLEVKPLQGNATEFKDYITTCMTINSPPIDYPVIDGAQLYRDTTCGQWGSSYIIFDEQSNIVIFTIATSGKYVDISENVDQILSTFEFVDEYASVPTEWETYVNEEYGFEFQYPTDFFYNVWDVTTDPLMGKDPLRSFYVSFKQEKYRNIRQPPEIGLVIYKNANNLSPREWVSMNMGTASDGLFEKVTNINEITTADITGISFTDESDTWGITSHNVLLPKDGLLLKIYYTNYTNGDSDDLSKIFDQILSTFEFME